MRKYLNFLRFCGLGTHIWERILEEDLARIILQFLAQSPIAVRFSLKLLFGLFTLCKQLPLSFVSALTDLIFFLVDSPSPAVHMASYNRQTATPADISLPNVMGSNRVQGAGVRETFDVNINNTVSNTTTAVQVNLNDTVQSLVSQISKQSGGMQVSINFAGTDLARENQQQTLFALGITPGSTLDISPERGLEGGK